MSKTFGLAAVSRHPLLERRPPIRSALASNAVRAQSVLGTEEVVEATKDVAESSVCEHGQHDIVLYNTYSGMSCKQPKQYGN